MAKLLLVEDDNNLREIYQARLQAEGYTIVSAKDGEEALVVAKAEKPDLIISDIMMPKISGFEMLDILRNTDELKHVKVIMLTALGQSDDQQRAGKLGADRYLVKSQVTLEDIVKVARELLGSEEAAATEIPALKADAATPAEPTAPPAPTGPADPVPPPAPTTEPEPAPVPAPEPKPEAAIPVKEAPDTKADSDKTATKPDADTAKASAASNDAAQPAAQEEADVEAKIEDFVTGASSEPTVPQPAKPSDDESSDPDSGEKTASGPGATVTPAPETKTGTGPTLAASDDKLMADAVEKLVASTDTDKDAGKDASASKPAQTGDAAPSAPPAPTSSPTVIPVSVDSDDDAADKPADGDSKDAGPSKDDTSKPSVTAVKASGPSATVNHEKIIQPPKDGEHGKDIKELLAEEEAKEAQTIPGTTITGTSSPGTAEDQPSGQPAKPGTVTPAGAKTDAGGGADPNAIAL